MKTPPEAKASPDVNARPDMKTPPDAKASPDVTAWPELETSLDAKTSHAVEAQSAVTPSPTAKPAAATPPDVNSLPAGPAASPTAKTPPEVTTWREASASPEVKTSPEVKAWHEVETSPDVNSSLDVLAASRTGQDCGEETVDGLVIQPLKSHADYAACVELQRATWGAEYQDVVPASILKVSQRVGGVSAGAFDGSGSLLGFVYGLTGVDAGRLTHWSHMLAVRSEYRNHGIGRRLKEYQRRVLLGTGVEMIHWTFDPLVARNAHLNLNRLCARVVEYVPDMYGDTGSELHSFGTDRFVVSWPVQASPPAGCGGDSASERRRQEAGRPELEAPVVNAAPGAPEPATSHGPCVRIEIPADVEAMHGPELELARAWRASTREAFIRCQAMGYQVTGFIVRQDDRCFYMLTREPDRGAPER